MPCAPAARRVSFGSSIVFPECKPHAAKRIASKSTQTSFPRPNQRLRLAPPEIRDGQFLGRGGCKRVTAQERDGGIIAVMTSETHDLRREAALMTFLSAFPHPHLLPLLGTWEDAPRSNVSMAAPVALFGSICDLADHLDFESMALSLADASVATLQVADAMLHLAKLGIDHGDVCGKNVLVMHYDSEHATRMHVCLGDLGEARVLGNSAALRASLVSFVSELYALVEQ